ncbi:hypothetical protein MF271_01315 (plasmid) [Deinococcus sp. KNUC1210]|uniref:hypothetical protein n=1 Tax=Deinococcus sp. KNUC1210 TaxID=2917691 RepID=UPI001EF09CC5|nr:hypothetical protein [Deinococcus sp. KNUC1210]ULH13996.1 hypothetical protein MF271_01315 [Deinococcus sp. KNUC1210]
MHTSGSPFFPRCFLCLSFLASDDIWALLGELMLVQDTVRPAHPFFVEHLKQAVHLFDGEALIPCVFGFDFWLFGLFSCDRGVGTFLEGIEADLGERPGGFWELLKAL